MEVKLLVGEHSLELNWEAVEAFLDRVPEEGAVAAGILDALSRSEVAGVRRAVASKSNLPEECAERLASDPNPEVIEAVLRYQGSKLSEEAVREIIQRDWSSINQIVGSSLQEFSQCNATALALLLAKNSDPSVRTAVAGNWSTTSSVLRQFLNDSDHQVRRVARQSLAKFGGE